MSFHLKTPATGYAKQILKESLRRYFAPLTGAVNAVKAEAVRASSLNTTASKDRSRSKYVP